MSQHIVVIGAVALGPKAASRFKRLEPGSTVTMIDRDEVISYGGCGIPYFVSGDVSEAMQLRTTAFHMVRDETFFKECKGVDVLTGVEAVKIDREGKKVHIRNQKDNKDDVLEYDKLVIATGSSPRKLNLPGEEMEGVHYVANLSEAVNIRQAVTRGEVENAVVLGAGFIGLEMAESLADMWGVNTTVVEIAEQIMPHYVSKRVAGMGQAHIEEQGVTVRLGETVQGFEGENGRVTKVITNKGVIDADLVVVSAGVIPNSKIAAECGLEISSRGGIVVNDRMETSDPSIYSGGDCVEIKNLLNEKPFYLPMGSMANRQGRVIGDNLAGGDSRFEGAVGSFVVKIFEKSIAGCGLSLDTAKHLGFDAMSVLVAQLDRAHFYPDKSLLNLELVVEKGTRRVLGLQGFGAANDALVLRINAVAPLLKYKPQVSEISNLELAYSPPFSAAMDILNTVANVADNVLSGRNPGIGPDEFGALWEQRDSGKYYFLDCREEPDSRKFKEQFPADWHNIPQGRLLEKTDELPTDKEIVLICNTGGRSYEAQLNLRSAGMENVTNLYGGMASLKNYGYKLGDDAHEEE